MEGVRQRRLLQRKQPADEASSNNEFARRRKDEGEVIPAVQAPMNRKEKAALEDWVDGPGDYNEAKIWLLLAPNDREHLSPPCATRAGSTMASGLLSGKGWRSVRFKEHLYVLSEEDDLKYFAMYSWARGQAMVNEVKEDAGREPTMAELEDIFKMTIEEFFTGPSDPERVLGNPICYPRMEGESYTDEE